MVGHAALNGPGFGAILTLCLLHLDALCRPAGGAMTLDALLGWLRQLLPTLVLLALTPYAYASPCVHTQALIVDTVTAKFLPDLHRSNPGHPDCCDTCRETAPLPGSAIISPQRWNQNRQPHSALASIDSIVNRITVADATVFPLPTSPPHPSGSALYLSTRRLRI